ncbi:serine hydrolase, partial [Acinetobacter baumannii]|uniref:serine hydrolase n=1 Tax=Acinetobacter baumannii TaxID=470 RepID=UPI001AECFC48
MIMLLIVLGGKAYAQEQPSMMELVERSNYNVLETDKPKSAVLIDANSGKLLWSENPDASHNPASIMKLMVLYLTYEAMEQGKFNLDTVITATERHQQIANIYEISNNKIVAGVDYPVRELIPMALVPS